MCESARQVELGPIDTTHQDGLPVQSGERIRAALFGNRAADFRVISTIP